MYITLNELISVVQDGEYYYPDNIHVVKFDRGNNAIIIQNKYTNETILQDSFDLKSTIDMASNTISSYKDGNYYKYICPFCKHEHIITDEHATYQYFKNNVNLQDTCEQCQSTLYIN